MKAMAKANVYWLILFTLITLTRLPLAGADLVDAPTAAAHAEMQAGTSNAAGDADGISETAPVTVAEPHSTTHANPRPQPPDDPCLPRLYRDWQELGLYDPDKSGSRFSGIRLLIDRSQFMLTVEGILPDGSTEDVYFTHIGLGDVNSPTPAGTFVINHIYCYPDVVYFDPDLGPVPHLYKGFLAPLLVCDREGRCRRFRQLGLHGFDSSIYPDPNQPIEQTFGPVSGGCIRVPEPCKLKALLIRLVGVGTLKQNERGCYHWLNQPVEVVIDGRYPGFDDEAGLTSLFSNGLIQVHRGLKSFFGLFRP